MKLAVRSLGILALGLSSTDLAIGREKFLQLGVLLERGEKSLPLKDIQAKIIEGSEVSEKGLPMPADNLIIIVSDASSKQLRKFIGHSLPSSCGLSNSTTSQDPTDIPYCKDKKNFTNEIVTKLDPNFSVVEVLFQGRRVMKRPLAQLLFSSVSRSAADIGLVAKASPSAVQAEQCRDLSRIYSQADSKADQKGSSSIEIASQAKFAREFIGCPK